MSSPVRGTVLRDINSSIFVLFMTTDLTLYFYFTCTVSFPVENSSGFLPTSNPSASRVTNSGPEIVVQTFGEPSEAARVASPRVTARGQFRAGGQSPYLPILRKCRLQTSDTGWTDRCRWGVLLVLSPGFRRPIFVKCSRVLRRAPMRLGSTSRAKKGRRSALDLSAFARQSFSPRDKLNYLGRDLGLPGLPCLLSKAFQFPRYIVVRGFHCLKRAAFSLAINSTAASVRRAKTYSAISFS